jgi:pilus assembly protein FimV
MARDKSRPEIALKLLEIYHARKSATAFENVAKELHAAVGDSNPLWQKAAAMGAQIDPSNPLYAGAATGTATYTAMAPSAKPDVDFDLAGSGSGGGAEGSAPSPSFDLDLDKTSAVPAPDLATDNAPSIDFDLAPSHSAHAPDVPAELTKEEKPAFDFDLSGLEMGGTKAAEPAAPTRAAAPSSGMALDLADLSLDAAPSSGMESVDTKLELAKAFLEIGDKEGAGKLLHEVVQEGSSAQQEEAKKLIASL